MRQINWEGCQNIRDLGGLPTHGGGYTRWRSIIRADLPAKLTPAGWQALAAYGVQTIIDVRGEQEAQAAPYTIQLPAEMRARMVYRNLPIEEYAPHVSALIMQARHRAEVYAITLEQYPAAVARIMRAIIAAPRAGLVIHCHAGKDRTGTIVALLLDLAQVPREHIAEDYAASQINLPAPVRSGQIPAGIDPANDFWHQQTATADMMDLLFARLDARYGGSLAYLREIGLSEAELAQLQQRLRG